MKARALRNTKENFVSKRVILFLTTRHKPRLLRRKDKLGVF